MTAIYYNQNNYYEKKNDSFTSPLTGVSLKVQDTKRTVASEQIKN